MTTTGWRTAGPFYVITASTQSQIERLIYWNCVLAESPCRSALVAQWIERLASNQKVGGSIPSEGTDSLNSEHYQTSAPNFWREGVRRARSYLVNRE
jgi:hypothetical protein